MFNLVRIVKIAKIWKTMYKEAKESAARIDEEMFKITEDMNKELIGIIRDMDALAFIICMRNLLKIKNREEWVCAFKQNKIRYGDATFSDKSDKERNQYSYYIDISIHKILQAVDLGDDDEMANEFNFSKEDMDRVENADEKLHELAILMVQKIVEDSNETKCYIEKRAESIKSKYQARNQLCFDVVAHEEIKRFSKKYLSEFEDDVAVPLETQFAKKMYEHLNSVDSVVDSFEEVF